METKTNAKIKEKIECIGFFELIIKIEKNIEKIPKIIKNNWLKKSKKLFKLFKKEIDNIK